MGAESNYWCERVAGKAVSMFHKVYDLDAKTTRQIHNAADNVH